MKRLQHLSRLLPSAHYPRPRTPAWMAIALMANVAVLGGWGLHSRSAQGLPIRTRTEPREGQFEACVETLTELGLDLPGVVDACGAAAAPKALSNCVDDISGDTVIAPAMP